MEKITYIVIDDESKSHDSLNHALLPYTFLENKGRFYDAISAQIYLEENTPDIIFLDIQLPGVSGIEFLKTFKKDIFIILYTALVEHAIEGYELNVIGYLLKPLNVAQLNKIILIVNEKISLKKEIAEIRDELNEYKLRYSSKYFLGYKSQDNLSVRIYYNEIYYIYKNGNLTHFVDNKDQLYYLTQTLEEVEDASPKNDFIRVNRAEMINKNYAIKKSFDQIELKGGKKVTITNQYRLNVDIFFKNNPLKLI